MKRPRLRMTLPPATASGWELALPRTIHELTGRQRAVLIFRDVLGWSAAEVAEVSGSTVASANSAATPSRHDRCALIRYDADDTRSDRARAARAQRRRVRARRHGLARRPAEGGARDDRRRRQGGNGRGARTALPKGAERFPDLAKHARKTDRDIPVIGLTPLRDA